MIAHVKVLILNWNGKHLLKPCLDSVIAIDYPKYSVIVIDNGSSDGSIEMIKENYPQVENLTLDKNYGFAAGYNRCFTQLMDDKSDFIMLLNNDTVVDSEILNSFYKAKVQYGDNQIYGAKIYYHDNPKRIWYAGGEVNLKWGHITHKGLRKLDSDKFSYPNETEYVTGCCLFTSLDVINQLNGFDEQFNMYGEDVDFCLRAKRRGIQCYYWPDAKLQHRVSASFGGALSIRKLFYRFASNVKLIQIHGYKMQWILFVLFSPINLIFFILNMLKKN